MYSFNMQIMKNIYKVFYPFTITLRNMDMDKVMKRYTSKQYVSIVYNSKVNILLRSFSTTKSTTPIIGTAKEITSTTKSSLSVEDKDQPASSSIINTYDLKETESEIETAIQPQWLAMERRLLNRKIRPKGLLLVIILLYYSYYVIFL